MLDVACGTGSLTRHLRVDAEEWQQRTLTDGSRHHVHKGSFTAPGLVEELGGGTVLMAGGWFVAVAA